MGLMLGGVLPPAVTWTVKVSAVASTPSDTSTRIGAEPVAKGDGTTCTVRSAPAPPKITPGTSTSWPLSDSARRVSSAAGLSASSTVSGKAAVWPLMGII